MREIFLSFLGFFIVVSLAAQQLPLRSQFMLDYFTLNPAVAGSYDYTPINLNVRQQWVGMEGAPSSQSLNSHTYIGSNVGLGAALYNEVTGHSRRTGLSLSFAYHVPLSRDFSRKLSFGLAPVFYQHVINTEKLTSDQPGDPVLESGFETKLSPDANFGVMFSERNKFFVGLSVFNLMELRTDLFQDMDNRNNPVERTYYLSGAYMYPATNIINIQPSAHIQYQGNTPLQLEFALRGIYNRLIGFGISYRYQDAIAYLLSVDLDFISIGYSYDMTVSDLRSYTYGSHEFFLSYRIFQSKSGGGSGGSKSGTYPLFY